MTTRSPERSSTRGRQAEARRNDLAVLEAARDVFSTEGAGASIAAVAKCAGVGVGTLYRRYGSKTELLQRLCLLAMQQTLDAARDALSASDPWNGLADYVRTCVELRSGALTPLAGQIETTPEMWQASRQGRDLLEELVARAQAARSLRCDATALDIAWLIEQHSRRSSSTVDADEDSLVRTRLLAVALDGLHTGKAEPLPRRPPSSSHYEDRWRRR